jgi:SET domain-containing protein
LGDFKIVLVAAKDIYPGEEILFDYGYEEDIKAKKFGLEVPRGRSRNK